MPKTKSTVGTNDPLFLAAALEGLKLQRARIDDQIEQVQALLGKRRPGRPPASAESTTEAAPAAGPRKRRKLSAAARARIAAAQKKRWAEYRKQKES
jgi:hypothetical protein